MVASHKGSCFEVLRQVGEVGVSAVHQLAPITDYKLGKAQLEAWDAERKELERIEDQKLSDITRRTILKNILTDEFLDLV